MAAVRLVVKIVSSRSRECRLAQTTFLLDGPKMSIFVNGFKISGYRSFGSEEQTIGPLRKINLFVGQNNSGKSNILKFIYKHLRYYLTGEGAEPEPHERFGRDANTEITFKAGLSLDDTIFTPSVFGHNQAALISKVIGKAPLQSNGLTYFPTPVPTYGKGGTTSPGILQEINNDRIGSDADWVDLMERWSGNSRSYNTIEPMSVITELVNSVANQIRLKYRTFPEVRLISPHREIGQPGSIASGALTWNGAMAVDMLARLQNPGTDTISSAELKVIRERFNTFTEFVRDVVDNNTATLQVSYDRQTILVDMNGSITTLESLGTGIHQLIILAIATTSIDKAIVCIEEPEINMHPALQRRLLHYWQNNTSNQYFITTHSAALIDSSENISVFHLLHDGSKTLIDCALSSKQRRTISDDLGFRPSDLLQANALIWVEGPSDRIYLKHLIQTLSANQLQEGTHYSFALYGGSLRAHYGLTESEFDEEADKKLDDLIQLLPINRNAVMIADSDLADSLANQKDPQKLRLAKEFEEDSLGFYWQTQGRTIENYLITAVFSKERKRVHPGAKFDQIKNEFTDLVTARAAGGTNWSAKKVAIARLVCENKDIFNASMDVFDKGKKLVAQIKRWNGLKD